MEEVADDLIIQAEPKKKQRIILSRNDFTSGTFGDQFFPEELEGEERMMDLDQKLTDFQFYLPLKRSPTEKLIRREHKIESLFPIGPGKMADKLSKIGIKTIRQLLEATDEKLSQAKDIDEDYLRYIKQRIGFLFEQVRLGPHGVFLWAASLKADLAHPIVFKNETESKKYVEQLLANLSEEGNYPTGRDVLRLRFGLDDGQLKTTYELEDRFQKIENTSQAIILRKEQKAFRQISQIIHPQPMLAQFPTRVFGTQPVKVS